MRILIAEDDTPTRRLLEATISSWGYDVVAVADGVQAWTVLRGDDAPQLAVLDWQMPGLDGTEICRLVRGLSREQYTYLIILTAKGESANVVAGLESGADDYVVKPFKPAELDVRLRAGRRVVELQMALIAARDALKQQAERDDVTGLKNRQTIFTILEAELNRARRSNTPLSVVMADLDSFKQLNDTYGHQAGDVLLREAARRLLGTVRSYDAIGRYGGEEFMILLPGCGAADAAAQAERMRQAVAARPYEIGGLEVEMTCSFGVASTEEAAVPSTHALIQAADRALYAAKRAGRNRVERAPTLRDCA